MFVIYSLWRDLLSIHRSDGIIGKMSTGTGPAPEAEDKVSRIDHLLPFCWEIEESFWMIRVYLWNTPEFIQYRMSLSTSKGHTTRSLHPSVYRHFQYMEAGRDQNNQAICPAPTTPSISSRAFFWISGFNVMTRKNEESAATRVSEPSVRFQVTKRAYLRINLPEYIVADVSFTNCGIAPSRTVPPFASNSCVQKQSRATPFT